jgi:hypothetical protein
MGGVAPAFNAKMSGRNSKDAVGCGLVRHIGGDHGHAEPDAYGIERLGAAGNDRHPSAVRHERLDQSRPRPRLPPVTTALLSLRLIRSAPVSRYS